MNRTKHLEGPCSRCGATIRYAAEMIGTMAKCPHCGQMTELSLAQPELEPTVPRRIVLWTGVAVIILLIGLGGALYALKRAQRLMKAGRRPAATETSGVTNSNR